MIKRQFLFIIGDDVSGLAMLRAGANGVEPDSDVFRSVRVLPDSDYDFVNVFVNLGGNLPDGDAASIRTPETELVRGVVVADPEDFLVILIQEKPCVFVFAAVVETAEQETYVEGIDRSGLFLAEKLCRINQAAIAVPKTESAAAFPVKVKIQTALENLGLV